MARVVGLLLVTSLGSGTFAPIDPEMELLAKIFDEETPLDLENDPVWMDSLPLVTARVNPVPGFPENKYHLLLSLWKGDGKRMNVPEYTEELAFLSVIKRFGIVSPSLMIFEVQRMVADWKWTRQIVFDRLERLKDLFTLPMNLFEYLNGLKERGITDVQQNIGLVEREVEYWFPQFEKTAAGKSVLLDFWMRVCVARTAPFVVAEPCIEVEAEYTNGKRARMMSLTAPQVQAYIEFLIKEEFGNLEKKQKKRKLDRRG